MTTFDDILKLPEKKWSKAPFLSLYSSEGEGMGRAYRNPFEPDKRYPSVTTILKREPKDLDYWLATKTAEWCVDHYSWLDGDRDRLIQRAVIEGNKFRDERAWAGTGVHAYIQAERTGSWDYPELDVEQSEIIERYHDYLEAYTVEPLYTELTVYNDTVDYSGTLDGIERVTDNLTGESWVQLSDIKTSRRADWDANKMQLSALNGAEYALVEVDSPTDTSQPFKKDKEVRYFEKMKLPQVDKVGILHLRADLPATFIEVNNLDLWFRKFINLRESWDLEQERKQAEKEEK